MNGFLILIILCSAIVILIGINRAESEIRYKKRLQEIMKSQVHSDVKSSQVKKLKSTYGKD